MKSIAFIIFVLVVVFGTYLNQMDPDNGTHVMQQDSVGSQMAAPATPEIPL